MVSEPALIVSGSEMMRAERETAVSRPETMNSHWESIVFAADLIVSSQDLMHFGRETMTSRREPAVSGLETMDFGRRRCTLAGISWSLSWSSSSPGWRR